MPEGMLQLAVSLFIFSREILCLHKLPGTTNRRVSTSTSSYAACFVQGELTEGSSIYLVFSQNLCVDTVEEKCLIAVSVRAAAQASENFLDVSSRISPSAGRNFIVIDAPRGAKLRYFYFRELISPFA